MWKDLALKIILLYPIRRALTWPIRRQLAIFDRACAQPHKVQEDLLRRIIAFHRDTDFGRDHGFATIQTADDFRQQVPVAGYERLEPYINKVRRGETRALLADERVLMFALTSGTTATRKYIPVTPQYLADYRRGWHFWGLRAYRDHAAIRLRPIVQFSGDWDEQRTEADIPCGAITGLTAQMQKRLIRWVYCVAPSSARIKDVRAKYYVTLRLSLPRRVGMIVAANPSTLVNWARLGDQEKEALIRDMHDGTLSQHHDIPPDIRADLAGRLKADPKRARELEEIVRRTGTLLPKDYWSPEKLLIGTWTGGTMGAYLRQFPRIYGDVMIRDVGLIASEGRMTIPIENGTPSGVLDVTSHYFEFIPEDEIDSPQPTVLGAHEVQEGRNYYIIPTTKYGMYRYHICDLVRVTGFYEQTPLVEFLSKGSHFANITGEKLSEYQVAQAMKEVAHELNLGITCYSLAPCWDEDTPYYGLFVEQGDIANPEQGEQLITLLERRLTQINDEYASKRQSLRLGPIRLELLPPGTWHQWDRQRLARTGGTLEQYKHPCLIADLRFRESMPVIAESGTRV